MAGSCQEQKCMSAVAPIAQAIGLYLTRTTMQNLFDIGYLLAYKGKDYSDFIDRIEIEKFHGVKFTPRGTYENDNGCKLFIHFAAKALCKRQVNDKVKRANGATDAASIEKEVIYILFVDPDELKASLAFLSSKLVESQDAQGITGTIINAFKEFSFLSLMVLQ